MYKIVSVHQVRNKLKLIMTNGHLSFKRKLSQSPVFGRVGLLLWVTLSIT